jgi:hypothetical protein
MITCRQCNGVKSPDMFSNKSKTNKHTLCKDCSNANQRAYRQKMTALVGRWKVIKGCSNLECAGHPSHRAALHMAHLEPKIGDYKHSGAYKPWWSKNRIKEELAKCRILCANCHSIETYEEKHYMLGNEK